MPPLINYQGRVVVGNVNFDGSGQFKFALVNAAGTTTYWSNDGTSVAGGPPNSAVPLSVNRGLYSVLLGDLMVTGMTAPVPAEVFNHLDVRLRVWFDDGVHGSQRLSPDQRVAASGYHWLGSSWNGTSSRAGQAFQIGQFRHFKRKTPPERGF